MNIFRALKIQVKAPLSGQRQAGMTLIELLIAMGLGVFLVTALVQVLLANHTSFSVQRNMSRMQEDARFATAVINKAISMAGYREDSTLALSSHFSTQTAPAGQALPPPVTFTGVQVVSGTDSNAAGSADEIQDGSDTVAVRFRGSDDNSTTDCHGNVVAAGAVAVNRFYIDDSSLFCRSDIVDTGTGNTLTSATPKQALVDNVLNMQILYGMSTAEDPNDLGAECYLPASTPIGAGSDCTTLNYDRVVSVRISLLLASGDTNLTPDGAPQSYSYNGISTTAADSRLYRAFTTTIAIRNKIL